jgi:hypothetical protein
MTNDESTLEYVADCMECEGFDYCFRFYSHFAEVEDPEFHRLRSAYVNAANALEEYVQAHTDSEEDEEDEE